MFFKNKILAAKKVAVSAVMFAAVCLPAYAAIPVIDGINVAQSTISALQNVAAVAKQIDQYRTQLEQYDNMLQNTKNPSEFTWSQVNSTINKLVNAQQSLQYFANEAGSIDNYLEKYNNVDYYKNSSCFQNSGCSSTSRAALEQANAENSDAVRRANADLVKSVDQQQKTLNTDAQNLQSLQEQATTAEGQMQALQAANQLAAAQGNQLVQIRSMLLAQNQAAATIAQQQADRQAQQDAAAAKLRSGSNVTRSSASTWSFN